LDVILVLWVMPTTKTLISRTLYNSTPKPQNNQLEPKRYAKG